MLDEQSRSSDAAEFGDPSRRTYLALERTLLAWWRTAFAGVGVSLAVGRLLPDIAHLPRGPFVGLGVGWGVLACALLVFGSLRQRQENLAIQSGGFLHLNHRVVTVFAAYMLLLTVATIVVSFWTT